MGKKMKNLNLRNWGLWIEKNSEKSQKEIDEKVVWIFSKFLKKRNNKIDYILNKISAGQTQHVADKLIMDLLVEIDNLYKIF